MFKRGFKTWCEQTAVQYRRELKIIDTAPLTAFQLADHLGVITRTPHDFAMLAEHVRQRLLTVHSDCWSAFTINTGMRPLIVYNPTHSDARTSSNIMHELAHLILGHNPSKMFVSSTGLPIRTHDTEQEEEATWLSGCLLLPRVALVRIKSQSVREDRVAVEYGVSRNMLRYRFQVTGVNKVFNSGSHRAES
jgi:Zn-dependent peptidase ImmA (M78 family)